MPSIIAFANGNTITYVYDAAGSKLSVAYKSGSTITKTEYVGNKVYKNGRLSMILTEEGYATLSGTTPTYYYYLKDHQGNNRVVVNQAGTVQQVNHYYPFGGLFGEGLQTANQPYKYNGKELDRVNGIDLYDYGARHYDAALGRWGTPDPLEEKYYSISSYGYVVNNLVNNVDLRGDSITTVINTAVVNANGNQTIQSDRYYYRQDANGNYGFIGANGQIYSGNNQFVNNLTTALADLRNGAKGQALVNDLMTSTSVVNVAQGGRNAASQNGYYITWNPNSTTGGMNAMGNENRPSYIGLGHEMAHIQDTWKGTIDNSTWVTEGGVAMPNSEKYATHVENQLRSENNIPLRTHYGIDASSGTRVGLESTRIVRGGASLFYMQSNGTVRGIPLLRTPYIY